MVLGLKKNLYCFFIISKISFPNRHFPRSWQRIVTVCRNRKITVQKCTKNILCMVKSVAEARQLAGNSIIAGKTTEPSISAPFYSFQNGRTSVYFHFLSLLIGKKYPCNRQQGRKWGWGGGALIDSDFKGALVYSRQSSPVYLIGTRRHYPPTSMHSEMVVMNSWSQMVGTGRDKR